MFATQPERVPLNPTLGYQTHPGRASPSGEIQFVQQSHRGKLVRQFRILGVVAVCSAVTVVGLCAKLASTSVHAQSQSKPALAPLSSALSSRNVPASIVASNISSRSLAVAPQFDSSATATATALAASPSVLTLSSSDRPNALFSFASAPSAQALKTFAATIPQGVPTFAGAAIPAALTQLANIAGTGTTGSLGDGGKATAAQFDLSFNSSEFRSGVATAPDGTIYIADTNNSTIRTIAGPQSSEPGIVRSVAGRFAARQNVTLSEPLGIALDRSGNLYIADRAANSVDILYGSASAKSGVLEIFAQTNAPSSVAVTRDGRTVFVSSADNGTVVAINTQTRAVRSAGIIPASMFPAALVKSSAVRVVPQGLSTDGAGNLFVAYALTNAAGTETAASANDQILRLDAFTAKVTVAARGVSAPGEIAFNVNGDLFVANQAANQILKFAALGVPAAGVSLTPAWRRGHRHRFRRRSRRRLH